MWKYQVYNENSDVVRWAEKYLINSDGTNIKLYDLQKSILNNKSNRKIVLGARRSGVTTAILIDILYNITHSDYRKVMIFTDNMNSMSEALFTMTTRTMISNGSNYIVNWSRRNTKLIIDKGTYRHAYHVDIYSMEDIRDKLSGKIDIDVYLDPCNIDSFKKIYDVLPEIMSKQVSYNNRLWICNTMSATAPLLHSVELHQLRTMGSGGDHIFHTIIGDI